MHPKLTRAFLPAVVLLSLPGMALAGQACPAPAALGPPAAMPALPPLPGPSQAPVSQADIAASPALTRIASRGATLYPLPTQHGLRAVFARNGDRFRVFYLTPDGLAEIGGVMWDASGQNVTRDQVADIPGVIPTVHWTAPGGAGPFAAASASAETDQPPPSSNPMAQLAAAHYGLEGQDGAPRVYMVFDPLCPYSTAAHRAFAPYVAAGRLQLALVPISINDYENSGASTPAAVELLSGSQRSMGETWTRIAALGHVESGSTPSDMAQAGLTLNLAAAHGIETRGTPTLVWKDHDGHVHEAAGAPDDIAQFVRSLGK